MMYRDCCAEFLTAYGSPDADEASPGTWGWKAMLSVQKHLRAGSKRGEFFPLLPLRLGHQQLQPALSGMLGRRLRETRSRISPEAFHRLVAEAKEMGNVFFGIVGGEPFMHPDLLDMLAAHPDCYFQIFTHGQFITRDIAKRMRELGNVSPLISVEGTETVSDERRGRPDVLSKTMQGLQNCLDEKVFTGVCTSLCQTNFADLMTEQWIDRLIEMGVLYNCVPRLSADGTERESGALPDDPAQQRQAREFVVNMRPKKPIIIVDVYYDDQGQALCPAATGLSHHINPWGDIEPCPIVQFTKESIHPKDDARPLREKFLNSAFLRDFRELAQTTTRGCIVLERPDLLKKLVEKHDARDATARGTALAELGAMENRTSQYAPGQELREKSWLYRFAKHYWFYDFGVYERPNLPTASAEGKSC